MIGTPAFLRMLELQEAREQRHLTGAESEELHRLETDWHNAALTDSYDIPVRGAL
jgi:hypothetical protein